MNIETQLEKNVEYLYNTSGKIEKTNELIADRYSENKKLTKTILVI